MKKIIIFQLTAVIIAALFALASCQSFQKDLLLSSADNKTYQGLMEIEEAVITLDGKGGGRSELVRARQQITGLEATVVEPAFQGIIAAWSGRLYLMEGRMSEAQREQRKSANLSPGNTSLLVLSARMERDNAKRLAVIDSGIAVEGSQGELLAERGRILFDLSRFAESVAAFDSAFASLKEKPFYEEAYRVFRNKAWELKDLGHGTVNRTMEIAGQSQITWRDLIDVARTETDLLRFITAGRDWPAETIFIHLLDRAFIPYTQDTERAEWPSARPSLSESVTRAGAAWFIWHIYAENKANRGLLTRYSSRFGNTPNARSPITDISLSSPFIDSILGCVESEFLSLPDGRNFLPGMNVKGSECITILKKIEQQ